MVAKTEVIVVLPLVLSILGLLLWRSLIMVNAW